MTYMRALGNAEDGFYPLGVNGMWHGGIHFGHETAQLLKQDEGVRAIADGEVVAYRLNRKYPEFQYDDHKWALYSTGFVLIRHRLQLPPSPKKSGATNTSASTAAPADEQLTFFSLYMHLLDWDGYQAAAQQAKAAPAGQSKTVIGPMKYWEGDRWYRVTTTKDSQAVPKPTPRPPVTAPDPLQQFMDPDYAPPPPPPEPPEPPPPPAIAGVRVCELANGRMIGLLPKGAELTVGTADKDGWARIATMKSGQPVGPIAGERASTNVACGWVDLKSLELIVNTNTFDQVVVLKQPVAVEAGEVVGYLGHYLRHGDASLLPAKPTRPLLHLEVFAGPDLPAFIEKSRSRGAELKEQVFLEVQPGAQLVTKVVDAAPLSIRPGLKLVPLGDAQGAAWVQVQPKVISTAPPLHGKRKGHAKPREVAEGKPVWVERGLANQTTTGQEKGWSDFPPSLSSVSGPAADFRDVFRRADLDALGQGRVAKDAQGRRWWYITVAKKDGGTVDGWVCEKDHRLTKWCGPWDWPGFEQVDGSSHMPLDMLRRYLFTRQLILADEDQEKFKASALDVNEGPLIKQLTKAIDANHDGNVTAQELARAQQVQWSAEAISHLVVRCESEWGGGMGKWDALSPLMQRLLCHWKSEMQRIEKLQWWDEAKSIKGFPQDTKPWHFHPVGLVGNFWSKPPVVTLEMLRMIWPKLSVPDARLIGIANEINADPEYYRLDTEIRLSHFFAQVRQEAGDGCVIEEDLRYYSPGRLKAIFRYFKNNPSEADAYGYAPPKSGDAQAIANRAYALRNGNGSVQSGDGWRYRGRGLKQTTGRSNYKQFTDDYGKYWRDDCPDFVSDPDLLGTTKYGTRSAIFFWLAHDLYSIADQTDASNADSCVDGITARINKGTDSYAERRKNFHLILDAKIFRGIGR